MLILSHRDAAKARDRSRAPCRVLCDVDFVVHDALGPRLLVVAEVDAVADGVRVGAAARVQVTADGAEALAVRAQRLALGRADERDTDGADIERVALGGE